MTTTEHSSQTTKRHKKGSRRSAALLACTALASAALASAALPASADSAGATADTPLYEGYVSRGYVIEDAGKAYNKVQLLQNHATLEVCINTPTHPDGAPFVRKANANTWCFSGQGAGLNDPWGCERGKSGYYLHGSQFCHRVLHNNAWVPAAKRPNMRPDGTIIAGSPIAWRPVMQDVSFANRWGLGNGSCRYSLAELC